MNLRILPEADGEGVEAIQWYEKRQPGLGDDFSAEWERAFEKIRASPQSFARVEDYTGVHEIRRFHMRRFPYAVIFLCRADEVVILSIAHLRRRPLYWLERLDG